MWVFAFLAERRRKVFPDALFADLFGRRRGRPSIPADVVAPVMVLQTVNGLPDEAAVPMVDAPSRGRSPEGTVVCGSAERDSTISSRSAKHRPDGTGMEAPVRSTVREPAVGSPAPRS